MLHFARAFAYRAFQPQSSFPQPCRPFFEMSPEHLDRLAALGLGLRLMTYPSDALLQTLGDLPVYRADLHGTVEMATDGARLAIKTEK